MSKSHSSIDKQLSGPGSTACDAYFSTGHLKTGLRTRAMRGASITILAQACSYVIGTVGTIILARILTPRDFGLVTMVLSFSLLLQSFGCNGLIEAIIQRKEIHHKQVSTLFWFNAGISLILALLFVASAPAVAWFYKEPMLKPIVFAMAFSVLVAGLSTEHQALLTRNMEFHKTSACDVAATTISLSAAIFLAMHGWGYWALVAKWVLSPLVVTVGAWLLCAWRPGLPARGTGVRPMLRFAFNTYGNFIMNYFGRNYDKILIGRFLGSQSLGNYDRAYHLSLMLPNQLINPLSGVVLATFSRVSDDSEKYRHNYLTVLSMLAFVCMPLSAALTLMGRDLILLLLGPQWDTAGRIFSVFGLSIGVMMLYSTHAWIHLSLGTPDRWFRWGILALGVTVVFLTAGLWFGPVGVASGYAASYYVLIGPALWYAGRPIDLKLSSIVSTVWRYYASALAAGLSCWFILHRLASVSAIFAGFHILARIGISFLLCMLIYLLLIVIFYQSSEPISQFIYTLREMMPGRFSSVKAGE